MQNQFAMTTNVNMERQMETENSISKILYRYLPLQVA